MNIFSLFRKEKPVEEIPIKCRKYREDHHDLVVIFKIRGGHEEKMIFSASIYVDVVGAVHRFLAETRLQQFMERWSRNGWQIFGSVVAPPEWLEDTYVEKINPRIEEFEAF